MKQHAISVSVLIDGRYRTLCACGYKGIRTPDRLVAESQADQHLSYTREVAELTRERRP